jgi:hypothetical protein
MGRSFMRHTPHDDVVFLLFQFRSVLKEKFDHPAVKTIRVLCEHSQAMVLENDKSVDLLRA